MSEQRDKLTTTLETAYTFECPCGLPLQLTRIKKAGMEDETEWCLGHFAVACSPLIHGANINEIFSLLVAQFEKYGHFPTKEEYLKESDKTLLEYDRSKPDIYP